MVEETLPPDPSEDEADTNDEPDVPVAGVPTDDAPKESEVEDDNDDEEPAPDA